MINSNYLITCGRLLNRFRSLRKCCKSTGLTSKTYDRLDFSLASRLHSIVKRSTRSILGSIVALYRSSQQKCPIDHGTVCLFFRAIATYMPLYRYIASIPCVRMCVPSVHKITRNQQCIAVGLTNLPYVTNTTVHVCLLVWINFFALRSVYVICSLLRICIWTFLPRQMRRYVFASVRLWARLLKKACMDLDEMLRVNRCRDMDGLINFWARSRNRISPISYVHCDATWNFTVGKIHAMHAVNF